MKDFYQSLKGVDIPSCYKVASITRACAILKSREKGERRRKPLRHRKALKPVVCITTGFFTTVTGKLFISLGHEKYAMVQLNRYTLRKISEPGTKVRSLTITNDPVSFFYSREVKPISVKKVYGVDRNEKNLTFGGQESVVQVGLSKAVRIKQTTREVVASFKRDNVRARRELSSKYLNRANHRTEQMLHAASNYLIGAATRSHAAIALEDLTGIDRLYRRGNGRGTQYRFRMNSWPHFKVLRMLENKSAWKGVTVIRLTKSDTRGSSSIHMCGEGLRDPAGDSVGRRRVLWCPKCKVWVDRDVNAAMVLSERGPSGLRVPFPRRGLVCFWLGRNGRQVKR